MVGGPAHYMLIMDAVDTPGVAEHLRTVLDEIIQQNKNVQIVTSSADVFQVTRDHSTFPNKCISTIRLILVNPPCLSTVYCTAGWSISSRSDGAHVRQVSTCARWMRAACTR